MHDGVEWENRSGLAAPSSRRGGMRRGVAWRSDGRRRPTPGTALISHVQMNGLRH
jgi:hypothetical protein